MELGKMNTENEVKLVSTIDVIKKKAAAVKKLEEEIVEITSDENLLQEMIEEGMRFEIRCKEQVTILSKNIEKTEKKVSSEQKFTKPHVTLPKMVIKPFSGDPISWMTFIDQFEATIDRSTQISDVEKFNYLLTYLEGDAKHTISGMGVTNANYKKALELLKKSIWKSTENYICSHERIVKTQTNRIRSGCQIY